MAHGDEIISVERALEANEGFYSAFEHRDIAMMSGVWEHSKRVFCVHPGRGPLLGWMPIASSWYQLFTNQERLHFLITPTIVEVEGNVAWVSCLEDLLEDATSARVVATNIFVLGDDAIVRMVGHMAAPVT